LIWSSRYRIIENSLGPNDKVEERDLRVIVVKRHYLGHMRFIGELNKGDLIRIPALLEGVTAGTKFALKLFIDDEHSVNCKMKGIMLALLIAGLPQATAYSSETTLLSQPRSLSEISSVRSEHGYDDRKERRRSLSYPSRSCPCAFASVTPY